MKKTLKDALEKIMIDQGFYDKTKEKCYQCSRTIEKYQIESCIVKFFSQEDLIEASFEIVEVPNCNDAVLYVSWREDGELKLYVYLLEKAV